MAIAILTGIFVAAGAHADAALLAARAFEIEDQSARVQTLLWGAHACSSLDNFREARTFARLVRPAAATGDMAPAIARSTIAETYAATSNLWLGVVASGKKSPLFMARRMAVLTRVAWVALRFASIARRTMRSLQPNAQTEATTLPVAEFRFCADYLEHLIRLMAFLNPLAVKLPSRITQEPIMALWDRIERSCSDIGYTWGVFNVLKYRSRITGRFRDANASLAASEAIGDLVAVTLAHRDAGISALQTDRDSVPENERISAREELAAAIQTAAQTRCPSLLLKSLIVWRRVEPDFKIGQDVVERLLDQADGCENLRRERAGIVRVLAYPRPEVRE